ncbi:molybdopterin-guanine dinucleotide biosynthesis protein B [Anaerobacillus isosaccharinicus]|uniref:Molybdopterin-guanine dinucleotide biosynthesis protein B n=1 Tax=Anaerobacillus isosaccharinicus TaxID=1532552 RepID=A0A1S2L7T9_9BACI|nr:molybdopterin-guanine dinucleotide biosynthesis protein B [Anaerobacillus isosaccharinicus]MBA5587705.1 molybdopterin-guanine dinucleotide biosynthesis protein B [Anaerobacillus isosaccharinicus]QOY34127.1 molybdopterin-guanine dinucleotide biosynthesis protein B [Anaerobacillus isosaccharinicus]
MSTNIIQVAGFSNSGKTTLVEKLVHAATKNAFRVGTIKHHGHGGELISLDEGKDSWKHRQAGAIVSAAVSRGMLQLNVARENSWEPEELLALYEYFPIDVVIIEGFKASPFPKVVIIKDPTEIGLLTKLDNIFCVISWFPLTSEMKNAKIPHFQLEDDGNYLDFLLQKLKGQDND